MAPDPHAEALARLEKLSWTLDANWRIPLTGIRFGVDPLLGLVPIAGDLASTAISAYLILEARRLGAPAGTIARMVGNVAVDAMFGAVPIVGTVFDVAFRANRRNVAVLREHIEARRRGEV